MDFPCSSWRAWHATRWLFPVTAFLASCVIDVPRPEAKQEVAEHVCLAWARCHDAEEPDEPITQAQLEFCEREVSSEGTNEGTVTSDVLDACLEAVDAATCSELDANRFPVCDVVFK